MNARTTPLLIIAVIPSFIGSWGTQEVNTTNCLGTIILHTGEKIDVDHIQIGTKSSFELYSIPKESGTPPVVNGGRTEISLETDPRDSKTTFTISQIKTIEVPTPTTVYIYKETDKGVPYKYLEVIVDGTRGLAAKETKIEADQSGKEMRKRVIKLRALKSFTLRGCTITPNPTPEKPRAA
jgi:hypothetical protein